MSQVRLVDSGTGARQPSLALLLSVTVFLAIFPSVSGPCTRECTSAHRWPHRRLDASPTAVAAEANARCIDET